MKIASPMIAAHLAAGDASSFVPEATLEKVQVTEADIIGLQAKGLILDEVKLEKVSALQAHLEKIQLSDGAIKGCDWSGAICADASFIRVACSQCRMGGWDVSKGFFKDTTFKNCKLDMANFRFAKLKKVQFIECTFVEADFQGAVLEDVAFEQCVFDRTEFANAKVKNVDLRSSDLLEIRGWQSLKGAMIDGAQLVTIAPQLAATLGLTVK